MVIDPLTEETAMVPETASARLVGRARAMEARARVETKDESILNWLEIGVEVKEKYESEDEEERRAERRVL